MLQVSWFMLYAYIMLNSFSKIKSVVLDVLFPPLCLNCKKYLGKDGLICNECLTSISLNNSFFCPICRLRLIEPKILCNHKQEKIKEFPYVLGAAANYDDPVIQNLIYYFKYKPFELIAPILSDLLCEYLSFLNLKSYFLKQNFVITPIPLHIIRHWKRGYNQSELIAKNLADELGVEMKVFLKRIKNTKQQAKARKSNERKENVAGAFKIINPDEIKNRNIILIDDVYTSGATASEAARVFKENGAKKIVVLVVAKA